MTGVDDEFVTFPAGGRAYRWVELAAGSGDPAGWSHSGATVDVDDGVWFTDGSGSTLIRSAPNGSVTRVAVPATECHGLAAVADGSVWIADPGWKSVPRDDGYADIDGGGGVTRVDALGEAVQQLERPSTSPGAWRPTSVAVDDLGRGSEGRVWVADGYGQSLVHAFTAAGRHEWTIDGSATGMTFSTPHGLVIDRRGSAPRLLIADRNRRRVVAVSLDGELLGVFGEGELTSPSSLAVHGDQLWITELHGGLAVFGADDRPVSIDPTPHETPEAPWPNADVAGVLGPAPRSPGRFGSPHGIAIRSTGEVVVTEWGIGGRVVQLEPAA